MASKGGSGIELDLDQVPQRETNMTAYDMMLSESQERMLMVLKLGREAEAERIFKKWELDFAIIGITTDTHRMIVKHKGAVVADIPVDALSDEAPVYERPFGSEPRRTAGQRRLRSETPGDSSSLLLLLEFARSLFTALGMAAI